MTQRPISVLHVISGLGIGGAETMLYKLLAASASRRFQTTHEVASLTTVGPVGMRLQARGIHVVGLGMRNGVPDLRGLLRLIRLLRQRSPTLVQTWMYHADLMGGVAAKLAGNIPVVWGIRNSDVASEKLLLKFLARVTNPLLSHWIPRSIVCCAERARQIHVGFGYAQEKCVVIPNGFDTARFRMNPQAGAALRAKLEIPESAAVVGIVARLHPMKDHRNFLFAAAIVARRIPSVMFILCGEGLTTDSLSVSQWIHEAELPIERVRLIGTRDDVENLYPALTVAVLSSKGGEGFPNVLGEALACGILCVATDIGDAALIVGKHGKIVPPGDPNALAAAILELLDMPTSERLAMGSAGRRKIEERYSLSTIIEQYESLYERVVNRHAPQGNA